jgi:cystathionine beta-lyase
MSIRSDNLTRPTDAALRSIFDTMPDRRAAGSAKWGNFDEDVLPLWVADMDFASPQPIVDALHARVATGEFGYGHEPQRLREVICARMADRYGWDVAPEALIFLPGLVSGLNVVNRAVGGRGSGVVVNTPVYGPFLSAPVNQERALYTADLAANTRYDAQGRAYLHYELDIDALDAAAWPGTRLFILCNPHNPVGRAYTPDELSLLAEFAARHDLVICSDEIHCDLLLDGATHTPIAALSPEIARRTVTLMAPSKTYNMPGLGCSIAIIPDAELRKRVEKAMAGIVPHVNVLGYAATMAAYEQCDGWLTELRQYLTGNRDLVFDFVTANLPQIGLTRPEATYLAWLDFRSLGVDSPYRYFLEEARLAFGDGKFFGDSGEGFIRLNFGCPRATLQQALERMADAVARVSA